MHLSPAALQADLAELVRVLAESHPDPFAAGGGAVASGLAGWISFKWSQTFPGDAERGRVLRPVRELTYADLTARGFDPHAAVGIALDYLRADRSQ